MYERRSALISTVVALAIAGCSARSTPPAATPEPTPATRPQAQEPPAVTRSPLPVAPGSPVAQAPLPVPRSPFPVDTTPKLPPIPSVTGAPLKLAIVYPPRDAMIATRDSNFILGSVGSGDATLRINGIPVEVKPNGGFLAWLPIPPGTSPQYRLIAKRGTDSASLDHPVRTFRTPTPPSPPPRSPTPDPRPVRYIALGERAASDSDRTINIRPVPAGTYKWFAVPGTVVQRTGSSNGYTRIRLDSTLEAYVANSDVVELTAAGEEGVPPRVVGNIVVTPDSGWTDVVFPLRDAPAYLVEEERDKLVMTLYSTRATTDIISYRTGDDVIRAVTWEPLASDRVRYVVHLRDAPYGYHVFFTGRSLVLRVRKPPVINRAKPLEGLTIAVDPGHPPIGSTGPTGLYEGDATLPIGMALKDELERRGARVLMTRTTSGAVELGSRPIMARRANAHAFVSIHLNALPDGINPITTHGTGTYFFHPHSEPLARTAQAGMVRSMGLRDLGVFYDNLAVVRLTWMPAILCEGAFIILPEQEAAMRDPIGQRAYARGVADGLEEYFRALAR